MYFFGATSDTKPPTTCNLPRLNLTIKFRWAMNSKIPSEWLTFSFCDYVGRPWNPVHPRDQRLRIPKTTNYLFIGRDLKSAVASYFLIAGCNCWVWVNVLWTENLSAVSRPITQGSTLRVHMLLLSLCAWSLLSYPQISSENSSLMLNPEETTSPCPDEALILPDSPPVCSPDDWRWDQTGLCFVSVLQNLNSGWKRHGLQCRVTGL